MEEQSYKFNGSDQILIVLYGSSSTKGVLVQKSLHLRGYLNFIALREEHMSRFSLARARGLGLNYSLIRSGRSHHVSILS